VTQCSTKKTGILQHELAHCSTTKAEKMVMLVSNMLNGRAWQLQLRNVYGALRWRHAPVVSLTVLYRTSPHFRSIDSMLGLALFFTGHVPPLKHGFGGCPVYSWKRRFTHNLLTADLPGFALRAVPVDGWRIRGWKSSLLAS
jgi:hypothetical protein